jgi:hypothetical protein
VERSREREAEGKPRAGRRKNTMGWKLAFALMLVSVALVLAFAADGEPESEALVREKATKQLDALRAHLLRR